MSQLDRGREAARRRDWDDTFRAYSAAADEDAELEPSDLEAWATAAYLLGRVDVAIEALTTTHHAYVDQGKVGDAVRGGFWLAFMLVGRGDIAQAGGWMARCQRLVAGTDADEHAYLNLFESFRLIAMENRYAEGRDLAERVVSASRASGDADLLGLGLNNVGRARIRMGDVEAGLQALDEAMIAVLSDELTPGAAGTVYCSLIEACEEIAELARAHEWTAALSAWCDRQHGMVSFTGRCLTHRSAILRRRGDWPGAEVEAQRACQRFIGAADEVSTGRALYELGEVHRLRGETAEAEDAYRRAREWGHEPQPGLAMLRLWQGRTEAAATAIDRLLRERTDMVARIPLLPAHVEIMLERSRLEDADRSAAELETAAATFRTSALQAEAERARGAVLLAQGDASSAIGRLREAHRRWTALEAPYEAARTRVLLSRACQDLGDREAADDELAAARAAFERLGAPADLDLVPVSSGAQAHGLTARELEVLRLVATGMTNQDVADELFLAVKTVDRHVGNILTKLAVPSRTAAAAFAFQHDLV